MFNSCVTTCSVKTIQNVDTELKGKSEVIYCPLQLSFVRTIHTFQGFQAGPNQNIKRIICDAGETKHEGMFPGLLYTILSRATTIGTPDDRSKSAIFFVGLDSERIERVKGKVSNEKNILVDRRDKWTQILKRHTFRPEQEPDDNILQLAQTYIVTKQQLDDTTSRTPPNT